CNVCLVVRRLIRTKIILLELESRGLTVNGAFSKMLIALFSQRGRPPTGVPLLEAKMQTPQVKLTRVMADPYGDLLPHAYVVHKQSQLCRCGHLHQWTQMMTETHIKSTLVKGKYSTIHRRVEDIKYNLPIAR